MFAIFWCIVGYLAECGNKEEAKALRFPKEVSVDNYVKLTSAISEPLSAVSVCTWMKKFLDPLVDHFWFSYAVTANFNEIFVTDWAHSYITNTGFHKKDAILLRNEWYHLCVTWSTKTSLDYYVNGVLVHSNGANANAQSIRTGGILILGQEQDSYGGSFDLSQSYGGDLYQLNVFSRKLPLDDVVTMYHGGRCGKPSSSLVRDIVISWNDVLDAPRSGAVNVTSVGCKFRTDRKFLDKVTKLVLQEQSTSN